MAPEIRQKKIYDGKKSDIFSIGVIIFLIVQGNFPFNLSDADSDYYFSLLCKGKLDLYWEETKADRLSDNFKDLMQKIFSVDPDKRPTLEQIMEHPWMNETEID